jgi:hypothetical protein
MVPHTSIVIDITENLVNSKEDETMKPEILSTAIETIMKQLTFLPKGLWSITLTILICLVIYLL